MRITALFKWRLQKCINDLIYVKNINNNDAMNSILKCAKHFSIHMELVHVRYSYSSNSMHYSVCASHAVLIMLYSGHRLNTRIQKPSF